MSNKIHDLLEANKDLQDRLAIANEQIEALKEENCRLHEKYKRTAESRRECGTDLSTMDGH